MIHLSQSSQSLPPLDQQRLADVHVAEELLAAVGAEALDERLVIQARTRPSTATFWTVSGFLQPAQLQLRLLLGLRLCGRALDDRPGSSSRPS